MLSIALWEAGFEALYHEGLSCLKMKFIKKNNLQKSKKTLINQNIWVDSVQVNWISWYLLLLLLLAYIYTEVRG